ncbi:penicillin-binding protein 2 [bacterium]|nr:penicillin-binding protein 2 [candidate division CSSED10-310 bacterium]
MTNQVPEQLVQFISRSISIIFLIMLVRTWIRILSNLRGGGASSGQPPTAAVLPGRSAPVYWCGLFCFAAILLSQAFWQLGGFLHDDFMRTVRMYDRRMPNYARSYQKGLILDRHGTVLAGNRSEGADIIRYYPYGDASAHIVGYDHFKYGRTGMEAQRYAYLNGRTVGSAGELMTVLHNLFNHEAMRGNDIDLTIDIGLQREAVRLLGNRRGAVVVMDPRDGDLIVCASAPGFDTNHLDGALFDENDESAPLLNRCFHGRYPPGSTFKIIPALLAIRSPKSHVFHCGANGYSPLVNERGIKDHEFYEARENNTEWQGHGRIGLRDAFVQSCNVYFAQLGVSLGYDKIYQQAQQLLLDRPIQVMPPTRWDEALVCSASELPSPANVNVMELTLVSIGQGRLMVSPLHLCMVSSIIANRGWAPAPRLLRSQSTASLGNALPEDACRHIGTLMREVVEEGTGRAARGGRVTIAGKTGTAENPCGSGHGIFIGFAPCDEPRLAFAVLIENAGFASRSAVPVAKQLMDKAWELGYFAQPPETAGDTSS